LTEILIVDAQVRLARFLAAVARGNRTEIPTEVDPRIILSRVEKLRA